MAGHRAIDGIAYSQFTASYRSFLAQQQPLAMRQLHQPETSCFVLLRQDHAGLFGRPGGSSAAAQIFVGVLGYSSYTFACAVWSQKIED